MHCLIKCVMAGAALAMPALSSPLLASTLLDLGAPNLTSTRGPDTGPGQLVNVATATTLTNIGFYSATPSGGSVKYMIWDGANSTLLFSVVGTTVSGSTPTLTFSPDFTFNLLAGSSYYFGIISDLGVDVGISFPELSVTQNGLAAMGDNSNYTSFASPTPANPGFASINLVLLGSQGAVPEPASWAMMIIGFAGIGLAMRSRRRKFAALAG